MASRFEPRSSRTGKVTGQSEPQDARSCGRRPGRIVTLEIAPAKDESEPRVIAKARAVWSDVTPAARRDWIHWIISAKQRETRARQIDSACKMLAGGKRRVCCFDRSGIYSKGFSAPKVASERLA